MATKKMNSEVSEIDIISVDTTEANSLINTCFDETNDHIVNGTGRCTVAMCPCTAYVSDSNHSGRCICTHTAAYHA